MDRKNHIGPKVKALSTALSQDINRNTADLELTGSQSFFIGWLLRNQDHPVYPRDLEREFQFSHPTVSGILSRMEKKGFVTFQPGETDKRRKQILVTPKAVECHAAVLRQLMETEKKLVSGMTEAEIAELHRLLGIAMQNLGATLCCRPPEEQEETE